MRPTSDKYAAIGTLAILFCVLITKTTKLYQKNNDTQTPPPKTSTTAITAEEKEVKKRPIIHAYHAPNKEYTNNLIYQQSQMDLIETWKQMWYDAGWDPVILTQEDAQNHPDYNYLHQANDNIQGEELHRWMAMSIQGGGFLTDIDTYPLWIEPKDGMEVPFDGAFLVYDGTMEEGTTAVVPSFMSGSASEWERMIQDLMSYVDASNDREEGGVWSDMMALKGLYNEKHGKFVLVHNVVLTGIHRMENGEIDCRALNGKLAFHLSHKAEKEVLKEDGKIGDDDEEEENAKSRAFYAREYRKEFLEKCKKH